jgi:hypothetical protein
MARTPPPSVHAALLRALAFRDDLIDLSTALVDTWFQFSEKEGRLICLICRRPFGLEFKHEGWRWQHEAAHKHEQQHVAALGAEKVAAAEMLYQMRTEEAASKATAYFSPPAWDSVFKEVWGAKPSVALPAERSTEDQNARRNTGYR